MEENNRISFLKNTPVHERLLAPSLLAVSSALLGGWFLHALFKSNRLLSSSAIGLSAFGISHIMLSYLADSFSNIYKKIDTFLGLEYKFYRIEAVNRSQTEEIESRISSGKDLLIRKHRESSLLNYQTGLRGHVPHHSQRSEVRESLGLLFEALRNLEISIHNRVFTMASSEEEDVNLDDLSFLKNMIYEYVLQRSREHFLLRLWQVAGILSGSTIFNGQKSKNFYEFLKDLDFLLLLQSRSFSEVKAMEEWLVKCSNQVASILDYAEDTSRIPSSDDIRELFQDLFPLDPPDDDGNLAEMQASASDLESIFDENVFINGKMGAITIVRDKRKNPFVDYFFPSYHARMVIELYTFRQQELDEVLDRIPEDRRPINGGILPA